ncbi:hypothetical protein BJ508DRAFT_54815 [Ascobolus immersus RN42]|uniref:Uncharacterized protein n=1 Tax=Ascobolus immersus RN42 TaxID=1160509 RepID=A0A3N4HIA8_ASCIM|nr:hypothetical protein BJ508DRAFT_54815 [Ascobolus immersus RN42]
MPVNSLSSHMAPVALSWKILTSEQSKSSRPAGSLNKPLINSVTAAPPTALILEADSTIRDDRTTCRQPRDQLYYHSTGSWTVMSPGAHKEPSSVSTSRFHVLCGPVHDICDWQTVYDSKEDLEMVTMKTAQKAGVITVECHFRRHHKLLGKGVLVKRSFIFSTYAIKKEGYEHAGMVIRLRLLQDLSSAADTLSLPRGGHWRWKEFDWELPTFIRLMDPTVTSWVKNVCDFKKTHRLEAINGVDSIKFSLRRTAWNVRINLMPLQANNNAREDSATAISSPSERRIAVDNRKGNNGRT